MLSDGNDPLSRIVYPIAASIAGAVTALSFRPFQGMSKAEIGLAVFVGATFAFFVGPSVIKTMSGIFGGDARLEAGVYYVMASGSNALIPKAIKWLGLGAGWSKEGDK